MENLLVPLLHPNPNDTTKPPLIITDKAFTKMTYWTKVAKDKNREVSGIGLITKKYGGFFVDTVWLIGASKVSRGHVEQDVSQVYEKMTELYMSKKASIQNLRFLWHSHVDFEVFWSGTDEENCRKTFCPDAPWTVNLVMNTRGHFLARVDYPSKKGEPDNRIPIYLRVPLRAPKARKLLSEYQEKNASVDLREAQRSLLQNKQPSGFIQSVLSEISNY